MRKLILAGLATAAALCLSAAPARADQMIELDTTTLGVDSQGSWHVTLTRSEPSSPSFNLKVIANNGAQTPNADAHHVSITFLNTAGNAVKVASQGPGEIRDTVTNLAIGPNWSIPGGSFPRSSARWDGTEDGPAIMANGSTYFAANLSLTDPNIAKIRVSIDNTSHNWSGTAITPEPVSTALLLPGLLPLGLALLKRRRRGDPEDGV
jgi:hypothetical protein